MTECSISLAPSGALLLTIPSVLAEGRSHTVEVPLTLAGLSLIKTTLVARKRDETKTIGSRASPVASDIQRYMAKKDREDRSAARQVSVSFNLEEIELDL